MKFNDSEISSIIKEVCISFLAIFDLIDVFSEKKPL